MKSQPSKKRLPGSSQKPPTIITSQDHIEERSRNQNKSQVIQNSSNTPQTSITLQDQDQLRIKSKGGAAQQKSFAQASNGAQMAYNSLQTVEPKPTNKTSFNTPMRGSISKTIVDQRVANSTSKLNNMTAVQLNQQQIEIEQQINSLSESFKANGDQQVKSEKIRVAVRVRPFLPKEIGKDNVCYVSKNGKQIRVSDLTHTVEGLYDKVFPKEATQSDAYTFVQDCIPNLLQGFNCTIFAYGQTGSGKTHTMFGEDFNAQLKSINTSNELGIYHGSDDVTRGELFQQIKAQNHKVTIYCSFLQIYNEKLYDLLQDTYTKNPLQIREEKFQGIYVEGLSEYVVQDEVDCLNLLKRGERNRIKRATRMNIKSSRSHTLFQLLLETEHVDAKGMLKRSKLNLGDLAGSEKINKDEEMKAKHMLELRNINLSLTTLGKVIQVLSQGGNAVPHVPFRESKLTRLLQDSIGGNCQTYLIATVSPLMDSIEETISTLKFADRAKCVMQRVKKNEINAKDDALVQKLQKEVQYLKELLQMKRKGINNNDLSHQLYLLKDENERLRQMAMNYEDIERMKQENKQMRLELQRLKMIASDVGSNYNGDLTPRSFSHASGVFKQIRVNDNSDTNGEQQKQTNKLDQTIQPSEKLSDSDESISQQFNHYKSELNFEVKLSDSKKMSAKAAHHTELQTQRDGSGQWDIKTPRDQAKSKSGQISQLKQQKERLQQVINEQQQLQQQQQQHQSPNKGRHSIAIRKRYKEGDLSDEGGVRYQDGSLILPSISDPQASLQQYQKVEISRKGSNQEIYKLGIGSHQHSTISQQPAGGSPYSLNRSSINPLLRSSETYLSDVTKPPIQKYPNRNSQSIRRSLHEFPSYQSSNNQSSHQKQLTSISSEVNRSYQLGSQGMVGLTTQSSMYGLNNHQASLNQSTFDKGDTSHNNHFRNSKSPNQTVVRIRGRYNQMVETKGSVLMTLDEEKRIEEKKKQLRRSNERLRMLETMERARQKKVERELEKLMADKIQRELEDQRKREVIKQRKYVNANVGILGDSITNSSIPK